MLISNVLSHNHTYFTSLTRKKSLFTVSYSFLLLIFQSSDETLSFSQRQRKIAKARFKPIEISTHRGTIHRLGKLLILMLKNLRKWKFQVRVSLSSKCAFSCLFKKSGVTLKRLTLRCNNTLFALLKRKKMCQELWPCHHMSVWELLMSCLAEVSICGGHRPHRQKEISQWV